MSTIRVESKNRMVNQTNTQVKQGVSLWFNLLTDLKKRERMSKAGGVIKEFKSREGFYNYAIHDKNLSEKVD